MQTQLNQDKAHSSTVNKPYEVQFDYVVDSEGNDICVGTCVTYVPSDDVVPDLSSFVDLIVKHLNEREQPIPDMSTEGHLMYAYARVIKNLYEEMGFDKFFDIVAGWMVDPFATLFGSGRYVYRVVCDVPTLRRCTEAEWRDHELQHPSTRRIELKFSDEAMSSDCDKTNVTDQGISRAVPSL